MPARGRIPAALARARPPRAVLHVLRTLGAAGHRSWLVGGAIRDLLLGRRRADFDVATPATPEEVTRLFRRTVPTGAEHGTVTVLVGHEHVEVTTFRGEGAYHDGRRPSSVTFLADIDQDLSRRDFTVNAMAFDPFAGELRDPTGGRADLARRKIRAVGDPAARFAEDGLRPLRAVRFAAQLGFSLHPATRRAIPGALPVVARVSAERVSDELTKLLLAPHAARGLTLLEATGLLGAVLPEMATLPAGARAHALAAAAAAPADVSLRLAGLFHALAASEGPLAAARRARESLTRLRFPAAVGEEVAALVAEHGCLRAPGRPPAPASEVEARRLAARIGRDRFPRLLDLWAADARALPRAGEAAEARALAAFRRLAARALRGGPPLEVGDLALGGREVMAILGVGPGPEVGEALRHLLDRVIDDPRRNAASPLAEEVRAWWAARD